MCDGADDNFKATKSMLAELERSGELPMGIQVSVRVGADEALSIDSLAHSSPVAPVISPTFCAGKPWIALALACAHSNGTLDLGAPVAEYVADVASLPTNNATLIDLLLHRVDMPDCPSGPFRVEDEHEILSRLGSRGLQRLPHGASRYNVHSAWSFLGAALNTATGSDPRIYLGSILGAVGTPNTFFSGLTPREYAEIQPRLATVYDGKDGEAAVPAREFTEEAALTRSEFDGGVISTAHDLAILYSFLAEPAGELREAAQLVTRPHAVTFDEVSAISVSYGLGVTVGLRASYFPSGFSPQAFGGSGGWAMATGFSDPALRVSVGMVFGDVRQGLSGHRRRYKVLSSLLKDLGVATSPWRSFSVNSPSGDRQVYISRET